MKRCDLPTKQQTIRAMNRSINLPYYGLCYWYYPEVSTHITANILRKLGGLSSSGWYWNNPWYGTDKVLAKAKEQRATMLAFLLTWASDPDFEV